MRELAYQQVRLATQQGGFKSAAAGSRHAQHLVVATARTPCSRRRPSAIGLDLLVHIRPYRRVDDAALAAICVRTAAAGRDARGMYDTDALMGDLFARPYAALEPEHCFVLDDAGAAVGYVVGTADTTEFVQRYRDEWIPALADRYTPVIRPATTATEEMLLLHQEPERMLHPELEYHPAHLHIDLLPHVQRHGWGRALIDAFLEPLRHDGVAGVHVAMVRDNASARRFYDRLGFRALPMPGEPDLSYLLRDTSPVV